jgi:hypothetical protein
MERNAVLQYFVNTYFAGDIKKAADATGYTQAQLKSWMSGSTTPMKETIEYLLHCIFTPEFKVIFEFAEFDPNEKIKPQLRNMLGRHSEHPGIYAFYDSRGGLLYIGKATNLLEEAYDSIRRPVNLNFPSGIKSAPERRFEIIRYVSAYDVGNSNWMDYPKHVESLILRLSKPPLNKITGGLEPAYKREDS